MIKVKLAQVRQLVAATFPEYRGRKLNVVAAASVTLSDLNWDAGSRSQYRTSTLDGRCIGSADKWNMVAPWNNAAEYTEHAIPAGAIVVKHSICEGKDYGLTFFVNPADMPALLPATA